MPRLSRDLLPVSYLIGLTAWLAPSFCHTDGGDRDKNPPFDSQRRQFAVARNSLLEASRRQCRSHYGDGDGRPHLQTLARINRSFVVSSGRASDVGGGLGAFSRVLRMLLQSAILAVGAC